MGVNMVRREGWEVQWREGWGLQRGRGREVRSEQVGQASPNPQIP